MVPSSVRMTRLPGVLWAGLFLLFLGIVTMAVSEEAEATHYRGGTLSWQPTGDPNEVLFTGRVAWKLDFPWGCGSISIGTVCSYGSFDPGIGPPVPWSFRVTSIFAAQDAFAGEIVDSSGDPLKYTYPSPTNAGAPWIAEWQSCCRIGTASPNEHINNPNGDMRIDTTVDLSVPNASPQLSLPMEPGMPLFHICQLNSVCTIPVKAIDPDGDAMAFRLATPAEVGAGFVQPGPPSAPNAAVIDPATGVITWDTTGATMGGERITVYSMAIVAEDGDTKTSLDFLISFCNNGVANHHCYKCKGPEVDPQSGACIVCGPVSVGGGLITLDPADAGLYICEPPPPCSETEVMVGSRSIIYDDCGLPCRYHVNVFDVVDSSRDMC